MLPDAAAVDARRTGSGRVGVYTGVWTAGETLGLALGPGLFAVVLTIGSYRSSTDGDVAQPDSALNAITLGLLGAPGRADPAQPGLAGALLADRRPRMRRTHDRHPERRLRARCRPTTCPCTAAARWPTSTTPGLPDIDRIGREAVAAAAASNGLDPTAFPSLLRMENDLVGFGLRLLDAPVRCRRAP